MDIVCWREFVTRAIYYSAVERKLNSTNYKLALAVNFFLKEGASFDG
ncbi:hypothetical protein KDU71_15630 [Carboxylicivirga sediminis]|uniref:Uncharacterized protein n=1 Tax=Carboxylicivirga sediminis TaxID=2006564 RepID=A0A941F528_9BACT|nr:hypothetical protein [Carboxylicivirga sediminis]MBR8537003.1 hypothetical protein [Carboxylicivirga sediminis]